MTRIKQSFSIILMLLVTVALQAQTEQYKIFVGSSSKLNFSFLNVSQKSDQGSVNVNKSTDINLAPQAGAFVINNLAIGLEIPFAYSYQNNILTNTKNYSTSIALAPFVRYYFGQTKIKPYLNGLVGVGTMKSKTVGSFYNDNSKYNLFLYQVGGGVGFFLGDKVSLDVDLSYASGAEKPTENNTDNTRYVTGGIGMEVGFTIFL